MPPPDKLALHAQVGVATDTARKVRAELAMGKYGDLDKLYDE